MEEINCDENSVNGKKLDMLSSGTNIESECSMFSSIRVDENETQMDVYILVKKYHTETDGDF